MLKKLFIAIALLQAITVHAIQPGYLNPDSGKYKKPVWPPEARALEAERARSGALSPDKKFFEERFAEEARRFPRHGKPFVPYHPLRHVNKTAA